MARIDQERKKEEMEIIMLQETVEQLTNNTLLYSYFDFLDKLIQEKYTLTFKGYGPNYIYTTIMDTRHLKNYINNITGIKYFDK